MNSAPYPVGLFKSKLIDDEHFVDAIIYEDRSIKTYLMEKVAGSANDFVAVREADGECVDQFVKEWQKNG
jgi:hypothetical protein